MTRAIMVVSVLAVPPVLGNSPAEPEAADLEQLSVQRASAVAGELQRRLDLRVADWCRLTGAPAGPPLAAETLAPTVKDPAKAGSFLIDSVPLPRERVALAQ